MDEIYKKKKKIKIKKKKEGILNNTRPIPCAKTCTGHIDDDVTCILGVHDTVSAAVTAAKKTGHS